MRFIRIDLARGFAVMSAGAFSAWTRWLAPTLCAVVFSWGLSGCAKQPSELVVYSARNEQLIKPIFDRYSAETGQKIRFVTDDAGPLIERLNAEGANSQADILMTVDAGELWHAADLGLFQATTSEVLTANIPESLRDPENRWFGF